MVVSKSSPKDVIVNVDHAGSDATLEFDHALKSIVPGTAVQFCGVVESYAKQPYMLRMRVEDEDVRGLAESK